MAAQAAPTGGGARRHRIASIPGDGIGIEVTAAARRACDAAADAFGFTLDWEEYDWSRRRYLEVGAMMPGDALDSLRDGRRPLAAGPARTADLGGTAGTYEAAGRSSNALTG